jgi:hypothetical protein
MSEPIDISTSEDAKDQRIAALLDVTGKLRTALVRIDKLIGPDPEDDDATESIVQDKLVCDISDIASKALAESGPLAGMPPEFVPAAVHFGLQGEFVKLARALGVEIKDGTTFMDALAQCHGVARAATVEADQYERVLAFIDSAHDAISYVKGDPDVHRAYQLLNRALPLLRELAGNKGQNPCPPTQ